MQRQQERIKCLRRNETGSPKHPYAYINCECKQTKDQVKRKGISDKIKNNKGDDLREKINVEKKPKP